MSFLRLVFWARRIYLLAVRSRYLIWGRRCRIWLTRCGGITRRSMKRVNTSWVDIIWVIFVYFVLCYWSVPLFLVVHGCYSFVLLFFRFFFLLRFFLLLFWFFLLLFWFWWNWIGRSGKKFKLFRGLWIVLDNNYAFLLLLLSLKNLLCYAWGHCKDIFFFAPEIAVVLDLFFIFLNFSFLFL